MDGNTTEYRIRILIQCHSLILFSKFCARGFLARLRLRWRMGLENRRNFAAQNLAESEGFEPSSPVKGCQFSRLVYSTALPALRRPFYWRWVGDSMGIAVRKALFLQILITYDERVICGHGD